MDSIDCDFSIKCPEKRGLEPFGFTCQLCCLASPLIVRSWCSILQGSDGECYSLGCYRDSWNCLADTAAVCVLGVLSLRAENEKGLQRCQNFERLPLASWTCYDSKLCQTCFPLIFLNRSMNTHLNKALLHC